MKTAIFGILIFLLITACSSTSPIVSQEVIYSRKGTKSESRSWDLYVDGRKLPDCFNAVLVDNKLYIFKTRRWNWGDDGYVLAKEGTSIDAYFPKVEYKISGSELASGWAETAGRFDDAPKAWFFVKWKRGIAALSPEKIDDFVRNKSLKTIPRIHAFTMYLKNQKQGAPNESY